MTDSISRLAVDRAKVLLFLAAFFQAVSVLALLACGGSGYWLLAWQSCGDGDRGTRSSWLRQSDPRHHGATGSQVGVVVVVCGVEQSAATARVGGCIPFVEQGSNPARLRVIFPVVE